MLVGAALLPHPPIILPEHAAHRGREVDRTIAAVQRAARWVAEVLRPDLLVVTSPHLRHGFAVPLHFLREAMGGRLPEREEILTDNPSYAAYATLGQELARREEATARRVALIASGDCSHRLAEDGPYGFHPLAPALDQAIVDGVAAGDHQALLDIDPQVRTAGAECGLRSFIVALAALRPPAPELLSYEAPYGVGYLVATATPP